MNTTKLFPNTLIGVCLMALLMAPAFATPGAAHSITKSKIQREAEHSRAALKAMLAIGFFSDAAISEKQYSLTNTEAEIISYKEPFEVSNIFSNPLGALSSLIRYCYEGPLWGNRFFDLISFDESILGDLGDLYLYRGEYQKAEDCYFRRIALLEAFCKITCGGEPHPSIRTVRSVDTSINCFNVIQKLTAEKKVDHFYSGLYAADTLISLAVAEDLRGNPAHAERLYVSALPHLHLEATRNCAPQLPKFEHLLNQVIAKIEPEILLESVHAASRIELLAEFYAYANHPPEAKSWYQRAIMIRQNKAGSENTLMLDYNRQKLANLTKPRIK